MMLLGWSEIVFSDFHLFLSKFYHFSILKIIKSRADSLVSVSKAETLNPAYLYKKSKSGKLIPFRHNKKKYIRRQDIDPFYFLDGSVYISKVSTLLKKKTFCHTNTLMYVVPKWKSIEIDDNLDLILDFDLDLPLPFPRPRHG